MSEFLPAPENVRAYNAGVTWTAVPGATHYKIYKRLPSTTEYTLVDTIEDAIHVPNSLGINYAWRGDWDAQTEYAVNDIVRYAGNVYVAKIAFSTECVFGFAPENWLCCADNLQAAPNEGTCGEYPAFNPVAYAAGWTLVATRDYANLWTANLFQYIAVAAVIDTEDLQTESTFSVASPISAKPLTPTGPGQDPLCTVPPSKPRIVQTIPGPDYVDIAWLPPDQPNAENIYGYSLEYQDPAGLTPSSWLPAVLLDGLPLPARPPATTPPGRHYIQPALGARIELNSRFINGEPVKYKVRVGRHSDCGYAYSDTITVTPATTSLSPAVNVTATPAPGGIIVNWTSFPVTSTYSSTTTWPVRTADIYYTTNLSKPWQLYLKDATVSENGVFIRGLQPNIQYIFAVQRTFRYQSNGPIVRTAALSAPTPPVTIGPWVMLGRDLAAERATHSVFYTRYSPNASTVPHYPLAAPYVSTPPTSAALTPVVTTKHITRPSVSANAGPTEKLQHRSYHLPLTGTTLFVRQGGLGDLSWFGGPAVTVGNGSAAYPPFRGMTTTLEGVLNADGANQPNQKVFVVNSGDGTISIVDVATTVVTDTIDIKTAGRTELYSGISYNTATGMLYVTERNYGTIKAINATTKQIVGSIDLGVPLYDVCVHKTLNRLYVATENAGIKVIDLTTAFSGGPSGTGVSTIVLPSDGIYGYGKTRGLYLSLSETKNILLAGGRSNPEEIILNDASGAPLRTMKNGSLFLIDCVSNYIAGKKNLYGNVTGVGIDETGVAYCFENSYVQNGARIPGRVRAYKLSSFSQEIGIGYLDFRLVQPTSTNIGATPGHMHIGPYQDNGAYLFLSQGQALGFSSRPRDARWQHGSRKVLLAWNPPAAPWPSNFGGYHIFARPSANASDPTKPYSFAKLVPPEKTWIEVTHIDGVELQNDRSYDFRIHPFFTTRSVATGSGYGTTIFGGYGQPLQTFTNIVPRRLWNLDAVKTSSVASALKAPYNEYYNWSSIALPAAVYNALAGTLGFNGITIYLAADYLPGTWWAANCAASFAVIITAKGAYTVPVSCVITHNTAYRDTSAAATHELGHALGIGTSVAWLSAVSSQNCTSPPSKFLSGTVFKNALFAYNAMNLQLRPTVPPVPDIPLLSSWPAAGPDGSGAVGTHWAHDPLMCGYYYLPPSNGDIMSYGRLASGNTVTVGALLDMGFQITTPNELFRNHFMATAERPSESTTLSVQNEPVWVPNETPQEIVTAPLSGKTGGCCTSANIIGTLYLDGIVPTNS